jgi:hypothetical protein
MGIGSVGIVVSAVLEIITKEEVYKVMMKIFPWFLAVGAFLFKGLGG